METKPVPYERVIVVCTNEREPGGRVSCGRRGGQAVCEALKREVKKRGLQEKIRVVKSGCLDRCEEGPNLFAFPEQVWVSGVTPENFPALLSRWVPETKETVKSPRV